ncbi:MAG: VOC family protein [Hyphomicrobiaceae bacterium]|nr:VOC family protein [Hyphomicrobiaceae bacterium]
MLKQITPMVPVADVDLSVAFFTTTLGFTPTFRAEGYAFLRRDGVALRLIASCNPADMHDQKRQQACYIDVEGLDRLYAELKPRLDQLPEGRVKPPFDTFYGQREFHVIDLDALLIMFGEPVAASATAERAG